MEQKNTLTEQIGYYIAPEVYYQLQKGKARVLKENLDRIYVIDGREGEAGKSTLAMQLAFVVDPNLKLDNIVFKAEQFEKRIREVEQNTAIIFDEAFNGLSSKGVLSKQNKKLIRLLQECRQRNLFIFIVLPSIFLLEKYVAVFRSQVLFHAYNSKKGEQRRYYKIYNYQNKKLLYLFGKHLMSYSKPRVHKSYRFYAKLPPTINREEYNAKKLAAFRDLDEDIDQKDKIHQERDYLLWKIITNKWESQAKLSRDPQLGLSEGRISQIMTNAPKNFSL